MSYDNCVGAPESFVCKNSGTCGLDKCYGDEFHHKNCKCNDCHIHMYDISAEIKRHTECGCTHGEDCWCDEIPHTTPNPKKHTYPDCYLGQIEGPGSMSYDECVGAPDSFVCKNSDSCGLDKCYGDGFKHENCTCNDCHEHQYDITGGVMPHIECGCTQGADCWCDRQQI